MAVFIQKVASANGVATSSHVSTLSISMGGPVSNRIVCYCIFASGLIPQSATLDSGSGDVAMTMTAVANSGGIPALTTTIFYRRVTESGFTGTLKITFDGDDADGTHHGITGYSITDAVISSFNSGTNISANIHLSALTTGSITIASSGGFLGAMICSQNVAVTWTSDSGTEDDDAFYNTFRFSDLSGNGSQSGAITVTNSTSGGGSLAWISFDIAGIQQIGAQFAGAGSIQPSWSIAGKQFASVMLSGSGNLQTDVSGRRIGSARFAGAGGLRANGVQNLHVDSWPTTLPQCPILNGFSEQRQNNIIEFSSDIAAPKIRRRSSKTSMLTSVMFRMTTTELSVFNTFYIDTLRDGTTQFDWMHPITKVNYSWMFDANNAPQIERLTPKTFRVSFNLVRLEP